MWHRFPEHGVLGETNPPRPRRGCVGGAPGLNKSSLCLVAARREGLPGPDTCCCSDTVSVQSCCRISSDAEGLGFTREVSVKILTRSTALMATTWLSLSKLQHYSQKLFAQQGRGCRWLGGCCWWVCASLWWAGCVLKYSSSRNRERWSDRMWEEKGSASFSHVGVNMVHGLVSSCGAGDMPGSRFRQGRRTCAIKTRISLVLPHGLRYFLMKASIVSVTVLRECGFKSAVDFRKNGRLG